MHLMQCYNGESKLKSEINKNRKHRIMYTRKRKVGITNGAKIVLIEKRVILKYITMSQNFIILFIYIYPVIIFKIWEFRGGKGRHQLHRKGEQPSNNDSLGWWWNDNEAG